MPDTPHPLTWANAVGVYAREPRLVVLSEWTAFFRRHYRLAEKCAEAQ
jgi:hypothetical protein